MKRFLKKWKKRSPVMDDTIPVQERAIVPWMDCPRYKPEDRAWQETRVKEMGYCPCCENLDANIIHRGSGSELEYRGWPGPSLKAVQQSAEEGCQSCDLLYHIAEDFWGPLDLGDDYPELCLYAQDFGRGLDMFLSDSEAHHLEIARLREGPLWTALPVVERVIPKNLGDPSCIELVLKWLRECLETHEHDAPSLPKLPTRVIEILNDSTVRLFCTKDERGEYLALSHHWGTDPDHGPTRTMRSNIQRHSEGIQTRTLTKSLREAIEITYRLGHRYIWIDSLCIIQDDLDDWAIESSKMMDVYGDSILTIYEANPSGCFLNRLGEARKHLVGFVEVHFERPAFKTRNYTYTLGGGQKVDVIAYPKLQHSRTGEALNHSPSNSGAEDRYLFQRGWVIQEWALAPRAIVFDSDELFWSCNHAEHCECMPSRKDRMQTQYNTTIGIRDRWRTSPVLEKLEENDWLAIVAVYSSASLTFERDRLPALSGLAKAFAKTIWPSQFDSNFSDYLAGCWRKQVLPSLIWREERVGPDIEMSDSGRQSGYVAPSWSWAGALTAVKFPMLAEIYHTPETIFYVASVEDVHCKPATSDPTGAVASGHLVLCAPTLEIELDFGIMRTQRRPDVQRGPDTIVALDLHNHRYSQLRQLSEEAQRLVKTTFVIICCKVDIYGVYREHGIIVIASIEHPSSYERLGFFAARGRSTLFQGQLYDDEDAIPEHVNEFQAAERRDEAEWRRIAYHNGVRPGDDFEKVNTNEFVEKLRRGDVDETVTRNTLLPHCTMRRMNIV